MTLVVKLQRFGSERGCPLTTINDGGRKGETGDYCLRVH